MESKMKRTILVLLVVVTLIGCEMCATQESEVIEQPQDVEAVVMEAEVGVEAVQEPESEPTFDPIPSDMAPELEQECEEGCASWYGPGYYGNRTANGEKYWGKQMTAAHQTLPFNTMVDVCRIDGRGGLDIGECIVVRINDRGPFIHRRSEGGSRIIDLSTLAAKEFGMVGEGTALVRICVIKE